MVIYRNVSYVQEAPWQCRHCYKRFKTEEEAVAHEQKPPRKLKCIRGKSDDDWVPGEVVLCLKIDDEYGQIKNVTFDLIVGERIQGHYIVPELKNGESYDEMRLLTEENVDLIKRGKVNTLEKYRRENYG